MYEYTVCKVYSLCEDDQQGDTYVQRDHGMFAVVLNSPAANR